MQVKSIAIPLKSSVPGVSAATFQLLDEGAVNVTQQTLIVGDMLTLVVSWVVLSDDDRARMQREHAQSELRAQLGGIR